MPVPPPPLPGVTMIRSFLIVAFPRPDGQTRFAIEAEGEPMKIRYPAGSESQVGFHPSPIGPTIRPRLTRLPENHRGARSQRRLQEAFHFARSIVGGRPSRGIGLCLMAQVVVSEPRLAQTPTECILSSIRHESRNQSRPVGKIRSSQLVDSPWSGPTFKSAANETISSQPLPRVEGRAVNIDRQAALRNREVGDGDKGARQPLERPAPASEAGNHVARRVAKT